MNITPVMRSYPAILVQSLIVPDIRVTQQDMILDHHRQRDRIKEFQKYHVPWSKSHFHGSSAVIIAHRKQTVLINYLDSKCNNHNHFHFQFSDQIGLILLSLF